MLSCSRYKVFCTRYKVTFGRGSAPYLATLPTILSEEEEISHNLNNNRSGAVNRNQMNSASSDTMALSAEEVEEVVVLEEGQQVISCHKRLEGRGGHIGNEPGPAGGKSCQSTCRHCLH